MCFESSCKREGGQRWTEQVLPRYMVLDRGLYAKRCPVSQVVNMSWDQPERPRDDGFISGMSALSTSMRNHAPVLEAL